MGGKLAPDRALYRLSRARRAVFPVVLCPIACHPAAMRLPIVPLLALAALTLPGCVTSRRARRTCCPPPAAPVRSFAVADVNVPSSPAEQPDTRTEAFFDGASGAPLSSEQALARLQDSDIVVFGEMHGDLVGARVQLALLKAMHAAGRPLALAMEFLERDVQGTVDRYLAGEIDEATFRKEARQGRAYPTTHGPLIEFCKAHGIPVVAANAPRPLVTAYRKSGQDYATYLAERSAEERGTLPRTTSTPDDGYRMRFMDLMGPKRGAAFFRSQALWDDAMAEATADFREAHPDTRVLLIVGAFHVAHDGGTVTKIRARRPGDRITTLVMDRDAPPLDFSSEDRGVGTVSLKVRRAKPVRVAPTPKKAPPTS